MKEEMAGTGRTKHLIANIRTKDSARILRILFG
jgi:hypothetical protein